MVSFEGPRWRAYGAAALIVAATITIKLLLGANPPYLLCLIGVLLSAWYGGWGPALFATGLSTLAGITVFALPPRTNSTPGEVAFQTLVFLLEGGVVSLLSARRQRAEAEARRHRGMMEATLSSISDAVVAADAQGRINFANPAAAALLCWPTPSLEGESLPAVVRLVDEASRQPIPVLTGGVEQALLLTGEQREIPVEVGRAPLQGGSGQATGTVWVLRDIRARRRQEEEQVRQARELARSNQDLQQFAYVISHDLQEPLRAITGYGQLLAGRYSAQLDVDGREFLQYIVEGAKRLQQLIQDLLSYSRVVNAQRGQEATVALEEVLTDALLNLQLAVEDTHAVVTHEPLPAVRGNAGQLTQLWQNLIENALKYRRLEEPPHVQISVQREMGQWLFAVTDNGIGVAKPDRERIFGVFQRLHSRDIPGTGVGLALCRRIVERHGGHIWAEGDEQQQGTTFRFTLPAQ